MHEAASVVIQTICTHWVQHALYNAIHILYIYTVLGENVVFQHCFYFLSGIAESNNAAYCYG